MQSLSMLPLTLLACGAAAAIIFLTRLPAFRIDTLDVNNLLQQLSSVAGAFDRVLRQLGTSGALSKSLRWLHVTNSAAKENAQAPNWSGSTQNLEHEASRLEWLRLRARRALVKASWTLLRRHLRTVRLPRLNRALIVNEPRLSSQTTTAIFAVSLSQTYRLQNKADVLIPRGCVVAGMLVVTLPSLSLALSRLLEK